MKIDSPIESHPIAKIILEERKERFASVLKHRTRDLTIVLDDVQNPHNISAVLRSADAFGVDQVHLIGGSFRFSPAISKGSERWITLIQHTSTETALVHLRDAGYALAVLQPEEKSEAQKQPVIPIFEVDFSKPTAFIFGNEFRGVSPELCLAADVFAFIPMYGFAESLNISVAAAIAMFSALLAPTKLRERTPLSEAQIQSVLNTWMHTTLNGGRTIVTPENSEE